MLQELLLWILHDGQSGFSWLYSSPFFILDCLHWPLQYNHAHFCHWQTWNANTLFSFSAEWIAGSIKALEPQLTNPRTLSNVRKGCLSTQASALTSSVCISLIQIQTGATWARLSVSGREDVEMKFKEVEVAIELPSEKQAQVFKWHC